MKLAQDTVTVADLMDIDACWSGVLEVVKATGKHSASVDAAMEAAGVRSRFPPACGS